MDNCKFCNFKSNPPGAHYCGGCGKAISGKWATYNALEQECVPKERLARLIAAERRANELEKSVAALGKDLQKSKSELEKAGGEVERLRKLATTSAVVATESAGAYLIVSDGGELSVLPVDARGNSAFINMAAKKAFSPVRARIVPCMTYLNVYFTVSASAGTYLLANYGTEAMVNGRTATGNVRLRKGDEITFKGVSTLKLIFSIPRLSD